MPQYSEGVAVSDGVSIHTRVGRRGGRVLGAEGGDGDWAAGVAAALVRWRPRIPFGQRGPLRWFWYGGVVGGAVMAYDEGVVGAIWAWAPYLASCRE